MRQCDGNSRNYKDCEVGIVPGASEWVCSEQGQQAIHQKRKDQQERELAWRPQARSSWLPVVANQQHQATDEESQRCRADRPLTELVVKQSQISFGNESERILSRLQNRAAQVRSDQSLHGMPRPHLRNVGDKQRSNQR